METETIKKYRAKLDKMSSASPEEVEAFCKEMASLEDDDDFARMFCYMTVHQAVMLPYKKIATERMLYLAKTKLPGWVGFL